MVMETHRGIATEIVKADRGNTVKCRLGENHALIHSDLQRVVKEGDEIIVAGDLREGTVYALALKNVTHNKSVRIDGSNYTLLIGAGLFCWLLGFVFYIQTMTSGNTTIISLNLLLSAGGFIVGIWAITQVLRIRRAAIYVARLASTVQ